MKRVLWLAHRWLGVCLCLWFAALFFSGGVMMYVPFPTLTASEKFLGLEPVRLEDCRFDAASAWKALALPGHPSRVRLLMREGRPAWFFLQGQPASWKVVFADDCRPAGALPNSAAVFEANRFAVESGRIRSEVSTARHDGVIERDQWTVYSGNNPFRPLHRIRLGDAQDTLIYVSSVTGEVIRDATRLERGWNWVGAVLHWLYWTPLRQNSFLWRTIVITASLFGCVLVATGLVTGLWRVSWRPGNGKLLDVPYRKGWMRMHVWLGLVFGLVTGTWILSGFFSMNAWSLFAESTISPADRESFQGGPLRLDARLPLADGRIFKEYELVQINRGAFWVGVQTPKETLLLASQGAGADSESVTVRLTEGEIVEAASGLMKGLRPVSVTLLENGDAYHYQRHETATPFRPSVYRLEYGDSEKTTIDVDPATGGLLRRHTQASRLHRWLYHGLHSFDFPPIWPHRPLWDVVVLTLLSGGFALSITGVVAGLRRSRKSC